MEISNIKVEIFSPCESAKYLGQTLTFQQQETAEIKIESEPLGFVLQIQTRADVKIILLTEETPPEQQATPLALGHYQKNTQRKMLRLIVLRKRKYKKKTNSASRNEEDEEDEKAKPQKLR